MMRAAERAGIRSEDVDYVEAHATGTQVDTCSAHPFVKRFCISHCSSLQVGDAIEGNAIIRAYGGRRSTPLRMASSRSNVGHMEAASFGCSFLKAFTSLSPWPDQSPCHP